MSANRYDFNKSFSFIQNKFTGTGHSDITKFEWACSQHRDSYASTIGHNDMLSLVATVSF
jgi:splicing factor 3B subunit 5